MKLTMPGVIIDIPDNEAPMYMRLGYKQVVQEKKPKPALPVEVVESVEVVEPAVEEEKPVKKVAPRTKVTK